MKNFIHVLLAVVAMSSVTGCRSRSPIYNVERHAMPAEAKQLSTQEIGQRIRRTLARRDWHCNQTTPNTLICNVKRRTHNAIVQIDYDQYYFAIHCVNTTNLNHSGGMVHQKYNKWIKLMEKDIIRSIRSGKSHEEN